MLPLFSLSLFFRAITFFAPYAAAAACLPYYAIIFIACRWLRYAAMALCRLFMLILCCRHRHRYAHYFYAMPLASTPYAIFDAAAITRRHFALPAHYATIPVRHAMPTLWPCFIAVAAG